MRKTKIKDDHELHRIPLHHLPPSRFDSRQLPCRPIFANSQTGRSRGCHEWWIEFRQGKLATPKTPYIEAELDAELRRMNDDYDAKRKGGGLDAPVVQLVKPGVFEHWMKDHSKWGGQSKMPRCRSDRIIADELARIQDRTVD